MKKINFEIIRDLTAEETAGFEIVKILHDNKYIAYWAGGAVRDLLLGLPIHDIDIATNARPDEIKKIFPKSYDRGKAFGVVAVQEKDSEFEIATFRKDIGVSDHRRPDQVEFTEPEEDASRRDFTVNGIFYDPISETIIDYVDGLTDIKRRQIRFIGSSEERINEDYLRLMRAIRFTVRLNFSLEKQTKAAVISHVSKIKEISSERLRDETSKILLLNDRKKALELMDELGLLQEILPEIIELKSVSQPPEFHTEGDVWTHTMLALNNLGDLSATEDNEELVWCVLLHDTAKPETIGYRTEKNKTSITFFNHDAKSAKKAEIILERFRFSHHFINKVTWAISQHMRIVHAFTGMSDRKQKKLFVDPNINLLLNLTKADLSASLRPSGKPDMTLYKNALALREKFEKESSEEEKRQVKKFDLVTGVDIMKYLNIKPGPEVGKIKSELEQAYLDGKINKKAEALALLEKYK